MPTISIRSLSEADTIRGIWEGWQQHPNADLAHFQLICGFRGEVKHPYIIVAERDGEPCALLVGRLERTRFAPSIGYLKLIRIPATVLTIVYQGSLGQLDEEVAEALVSHLRFLLLSRKVDAVTAHHLPESSPLLKFLLNRCSQWLLKKSPEWSTHWEMVLQDKPGFLLKKLGSKHRYAIRKRERELESAFPGKVSWRWMNRFDDVPGLCSRLEVVAARTYQRGLGAGFVDNEEHRQRLVLFAIRGHLRVQLLEIDGKVRAFWFGQVYRGVFHSDATGYDPDLGEYQIGTLVFLHLVDELVKEGVRKLDFGLGDAQYKQRFGDESWRETTVTMFAPTAKGLLLKSVLWGCSVLDRAGRRLLEKTGLLDRIKTGWRKQLASKTMAGAE